MSRAKKSPVAKCIAALEHGVICGCGLVTSGDGGCIGLDPKLGIYACMPIIQVDLKQPLHSDLYLYRQEFHSK